MKITSQFASECEVFFIFGQYGKPSIQIDDYVF